MENKEINILNNNYKQLVRNPNSVLYAIDVNVINKNLLKKIKNSSFNNDVLFAKRYLNFIKTNQLINPLSVSNNNNIPIITKFTSAPFYNRSTLFSIGGPFQLLHADIADLSYLKPSASEPRYVLVAVDLFSSKIYTYPMKKRDNIVKYLTLLYEDLILDGRNENELLRLQTDQEFHQNKIKTLNKEHNVISFYSNINGGHAFAAEQKIRDLKFIITKSHRIAIKDQHYKKKIKGQKRQRPNIYGIVKNATVRLNSVKSEKYKTIPNKVQKITSHNEMLKQIYNNYRLNILNKSTSRYNRYIDNKYKRNNKMLRPLKIGDEVLVLSSRLKKKDNVHSAFYKPTTDKKSAFNKDYVFKISNILKVRNGSYMDHFYYSVHPDRSLVGDIFPRYVSKLKKERFTRSELFALYKNKNVYS